MRAAPLLVSRSSCLVKAKSYPAVLGPMELWATRLRHPTVAANPQGSPRPPTPPPGSNNSMPNGGGYFFEANPDDRCATIENTMRLFVNRSSAAKRKLLDRTYQAPFQQPALMFAFKGFGRNNLFRNGGRGRLEGAHSRRQDPKTPV